VIRQTGNEAQSSSIILETEKAEEETDIRRENERSYSAQVIKENSKLLPQTSGKKTIVTTEVEKEAKCSSNQGIVEYQSGESRLPQNTVAQEQIWPTHGKVKLVQSIHKPPHLRSKVSTIVIV
jgi:hypothetical protein